jgi:hypothetical protein
VRTGFRGSREMEIQQELKAILEKLEDDSGDR